MPFGFPSEQAFSFTGIPTEPVINKIAGISEAIPPLETLWKDVDVSDDSTRDRMWESPFAGIASFEQSCVVLGHGDPVQQDLELLAGSALKAASLSHLKVLSADTHNCLNNRAVLLNVVEALCRSPVALFALGEQMGLTNMTGMLLLGIRAAVRRGVSMLVHNQEIGPEEWNKLPFNLRELQVLELPRAERSAYVLSESLRSADAILRGDSAGYRDMPVFEIVRRTTRRTPPLPPDELELFTLCSFSERYEEKLWSTLTVLLFPHQGPNGGKLKLKRVTDYSSPLLVAERLYELIRFAGQCVVDWSEWRPNVFFEFGVRLAVNPILPISIIQESDLEGADKDPGRRKLVQMFRPIPYPVENPGRRGDQFVETFLAELESRMRIAPRRQTVYATASRSATLKQERGGVPLYELLNHEAEQLVAGDIVRTGRMPVLYGDNENVAAQAKDAAVELLWSAYLLAKGEVSSGAASRSTGAEAYRKRIGSLLFDLLEVVESNRFAGIRTELDEEDF